MRNNYREIVAKTKKMAYKKLTPNSNKTTGR